MRNKLLSGLLGLLFYKGSDLSFDKNEIDFYEKLYRDALSGGGPIINTGRYPKHRFIQYITDTLPVILHGSNNKDIHVFEPRKQTLFNGKYEVAVFGTRDSIWPQFYAVLDRSKLVGDFRNACLKVGEKRGYYFFSLNKDTLAAKPWASGAVYFLPDESFEPVSQSTIRFDEWISKAPVRPLASIHIEPEDFTFLKKVSCHKSSEQIWLSWLLYKWRTMKSGDNI